MTNLTANIPRTRAWNDLPGLGPCTPVTSTLGRLRQAGAIWMI